MSTPNEPRPRQRARCRRAWDSIRRIVTPEFSGAPSADAHSTAMKRRRRLEAIPERGASATTTGYIAILSLDDSPRSPLDSERLE
jgi:hypothetical protein